MNNGEETRENVSEVASPDPFHKSDGGDESPASLSRYSSCGESEFERYCSANSVMGTPSVRSSLGTPFNDFLDSEFGSFKSVGCGDDVSFENFSLGGNRKLSAIDRHRMEFSLGSENLKWGSGFCGLQLYEDNDDHGENGHHDIEVNNTDDVRADKLELESSAVNVRTSGNGGGDERRFVDDQVRNFDADGKDLGSCLEGLGAKSGLELNEREMEGEEDGTSSRYGHSEGEDSMYNYGSDDENWSHSYLPRSVEHIQKEQLENENPLLINSKVAFGSDDWNDFEQEVGGSTLCSLTLEKHQERREQDLEIEKNQLDANSTIVIGLPSGFQEGKVNDVSVTPVMGEKVQRADESQGTYNHSVATSDSLLFSAEPKCMEEVKEISAVSYQVQGADELAVSTKSSPCPGGLPEFPGPGEDVKDVANINSQLHGTHDVTTYINDCSVSDVFEMKQEPRAEKPSLEIGLNSIDNGMEKEHSLVSTINAISSDNYGDLESQMFGDIKAQVDLFADVSGYKTCSDSTSSPEKLHVEYGDCKQQILQPTYRAVTTSEHLPASADTVEDHPETTKSNNHGLNDLYDDVVLEMEEILLDYSESPGARFCQGNQRFPSQLSLPVRDGSSTASTSGTDDLCPQTPQPLRIDGVEVVGARQKKGDVSLGERLVGVKKYTVYIIRVWSGKDHWEVERRYRDFFTLYRRLKSVFADHGWNLPLPWISVDKESRKMFGNASPDAVAERSILIQECLQSIIQSGAFSCLPSALIWFLSPQESLPGSPRSSSALVTPSKIFSRGSEVESISTLGKTISLIVEIRPPKSMKQLLESQHYTCAGCHKHFDEGMTLLGDFVQKLGWGKPRLCEYNGQLFCSSCHTNETAVLPAEVLHHWDFTRYPVSQLAKSYLDSVHDQPMLCVNAVNPFLSSKVPALLHVMGVRKKISTMLPYVHCPFRRSINKGLGSRRYLVESNDFFALRDLIDLSKGPFAALPVMLENISRKILEHITEQCLICCDVGVPCCARQACNDPSSLIFPFQESEIERCKSCEAVFHKPCFTKLTICSCGSPLGVHDGSSSLTRVTPDDNSMTNRVLSSSKSGSGLSKSLFSGLFSKGTTEKTENKVSNNVILMGSLPNTSL